MLEGRRTNGEFEIGVGGLDVAGSFEEGLILAVVIQDTPSVLFNCAISNNVIYAIRLHKGEAQLLESSEAIQTNRRVDVENEDNYANASDSR